MDKYNNMKKLLLLISLTISVTVSQAQVYVNHAASGANNGTSWTNAYTDLKTAIDNTTSGEIWVAQGTYKPTSGTDRTISFELKDNVQLYGGFIGTETALSQRNYTNNETILSGDIGVQNDTTDNTHHVVQGDGSSTPITNSSVLDGFTIRDGNATSSAGGGILLSFADPLISNCKIINNRSGIFGGAIFCQFSNLLFFNTTFENNEAIKDGGAVYSLFSNLDFTNCTFLGNFSLQSGGGAILGTGSTTTTTNLFITNCIFEDNSSDFAGGAILLYNTNLNVDASIFNLNYSDNEGGAFNINGGTSDIKNCTFSQNGGALGGGAISFSNVIGTVSHCVFKSNTAIDIFSSALIFGGAISNISNADLTIINSTFKNNNSFTSGGAIFNEANLSIYNSSFYKNGLFASYFSSAAGAIYNSSNLSMHNTILYENFDQSNSFLDYIDDATGTTSTITNCIGKGFPNYTTNADVNPLFDNTTTLTLQSNSPAIDAGDNSAIPAGVTTDFFGNPRIINGTVDIGAFELGACSNVTNNRIYVDANNNSGIYNGHTWGSAFQDLQTALTFAQNCAAVQEIWIANGTYYPTSGTDRTISFELQDGIAIYGGFAGNETSLSSRNIENNPTILSGDIGTAGNNTDNSYHVVQSINNDNTAILDGFIIEKGKANVTGNNFGGGYYGDASDAIIQNCTFRDNYANNGGGFAHRNASTPQIINCIFHNNNAVYGGALYLANCNSTLTNCTIIKNTASGSGGGIFKNGGSATVINTILWNNSATTNNELNGSGFTVNHSIVEGGYVGTNNLNQNPFFVDFANNDFSVELCSPAINTGTAVTHTTDILGNSHNGTVDMGAYEYQGTSYNYTNAIYVDVNATGNNDGSSWANAFTDLQDAIDNHCSDFEIWVASGTYVPTKDHTGNNAPTDNREKNFHLHKDMKIYGGFDGTETALSQRDLATNVTILSGDLNNNDVVTGIGSTLSITNNTENSYHVLITANLTNAAVIDGFTIENGYADGTISQGITYQSEDFLHAHGGGMYNYSSSPTMKNIVFTNNVTNNDGGGMYNHSSSPSITNTVFANNFGDDGGGIYNLLSSPTIINATFVNNTVVSDGGGIFNFSASSPTVTNTIFWNNTINGFSNTVGADIKNSGTTATVTYCLTQANSTYSSGTGIINNQDPLFTDAANNDFGLIITSPAFNTGNNSAIPVGITKDIIGKNRIVGITVDLGAYEYNYCNDIANNRIYVDAANTAGTADGLSWTTAFQDLQTALEAAENFSCIQEIWVAAGTYYPTSGTDRTISFELIDDVKIYGGFAGTETDITQRNLLSIQNNPTILSGDIGILSDITDNSYHIIQSINNNSTTILDGFIIEQGNANGSGSYVFGAGYFGDASDVMISNCTFRDNQAIGSGAAVYHYNSSTPQFINCIFHDNNILGLGAGGAAYLENNSASFVNCLFYNNSTPFGGGAVYTISAFNITITNCTFTGNTAAAGGALSGRSTITNSIFWNNTAPTAKEIDNMGAMGQITYSIIEGGYTGTANLNQDPLFVDAVNNDYATQVTSPATDAGNNAAIPLGITTDLAGYDRIINGTVNIGAYETSSSILPVELLYFKGENIDNGNLLTWETTSEINNLGFEIQRSEDGRNWFKIGFVEGNGTTLDNQFYNFIDENPINGVNYYRLKQIDFDNDFDYSNIVNIQTIQHSNNQTLTIYPNPVRNELTVVNGEGNVLIFNSLGQIVKELAIVNYQLSIDLSDLKSGIYTLKLQKTNGSIVTEQFVKY